MLFELIRRENGIGLGNVRDFSSTVNNQKIGSDCGGYDDKDGIVLFVDFGIMEEDVVDLEDDDKEQDKRNKFIFIVH